MEGSGQEGAKQRHVVPREEDRENSACPVVAADVIAGGETSNGLAATRDAACAAWVRSKVEEAVRLLGDAEVDRARALLEEIIRSS